MADVLSRYPLAQPSASDGEDVLADLFRAWLPLAESKADYEDWLLKIYKYLVSCDQTVDGMIKTKGRDYKIQDNHLYRIIGQRLVKAPYLSEKNGVLQEVHDDHGHFGQDATWAKLYHRYW